MKIITKISLVMQFFAFLMLVLTYFNYQNVTSFANELAAVDGQAAGRLVALATRTTLFIGLSQIAMILIMFSLFIITVTRPLEKLSSQIDEISKGKYDVTIDTDADDEIGQVAGSLNRVATSMKLAVKMMKKEQD